MNPLKLLAIIIDYLLGLAVVLIGLTMLPTLHLVVLWILFNISIWIAAPIALVWADKKNREATQSENTEKVG